MGLNHSPAVVASNLLVCLDAANPVSYPTNMPTQVEYLIVGGGGGGGGGSTAGLRSGGGGGAGGVLTGFTNITNQIYNIVVGAGGTAGTPGNAGSTGQSSSAFGFTALGGGGGAGGDNGVATTGGSGGGGSGSSSAALNEGAAGTAGQGFAGGVGTGLSPFSGGSGGGAGAPGLGGGIGTSSSITGTATFYSGGGGGGNSVTGGVGGGTGGGGTGGGGVGVGSAGTVGTANTGGGGGGAGGQNATSFSGGAGGSGVVIIRYPGAQQASGGTVTSVGGFTIHRFTSNGTFGPLTWRDTSGNAKNASLFNGVGYSSANGGSLTFNGSNQYALVGALTSGLTTTMSFSIWFRTNSLAATQTLWWDDDGQSGGDSWISIETSGRIQSNRNPDGYGVLQSNAIIAPGTWYNFTFVANGSSGKLFYINGVLDNSDAVPISSRAGRSYVSIGVNTPSPPNPSSGYFNGNIGIFSTYSVALTADQVNQNFQALRGRYGI